MPEATDAQPRTSARGTRHGRDAGATAEADLTGIDALVDRLVPALTAKLASTHLGELEVRQGEWRIRLRRPAGAGWNGELRRATDRAGDRAAGAGRGQAGHDPHAQGRGATDAHRGSVDGQRVPTPGGSNGTGVTAGTGLAAAASHPEGAGRAPRPAHEDESQRVATSPAVGVFRPGSRAAVGTRVREGDALGHIDVLGVPEEVPAPADGMVTELLVEGGTAVEYGQELVLVALRPGSPAEAGHA